MKAAWVIARLTAIETMRRQIQLITLFLCVLIMALPMAVNAFGLGASQRVVKDVGLTVIGFYATALAIFFGSVAVPGEIERKTLYPLITRPMPRRSYLWGKWLGLMAFIAFSIIVLAGALEVSTAYFLGDYDWALWKAIVGYITEAGVLTAACMTFSTFSSPPLAAVLGLTAYIMGGLPSAFIKMLLKKQEMSRVLAEALKAVLPHFEFFHVKNAVVHGQPLPADYVWAVVAYGAVWIVFLHLVGEAFFERRDL